MPPLIGRPDIFRELVLVADLRNIFLDFLLDILRLLIVFFTPS